MGPCAKLFSGRLCFSLMLVLFVSLTPINSPADMIDAEIEYLLRYIEQSGCTFIRNGKKSTATDARQHIERKYEYLRSRIGTAEEFIQHAATKSSMTGNQYKVICDNTEELSGNWLKDELERFRIEKK